MQETVQTPAAVAERYYELLRAAVNAKAQLESYLEGVLRTAGITGQANVRNVVVSGNKAILIVDRPDPPKPELVEEEKEKDAEYKEDTKEQTEDTEEKKADWSAGFSEEEEVATDAGGTQAADN